ncbi:MAG: 2-amino-4-hydroxy-6-hydroxymethyldihydropteridine diphosphokinase [Candidatus Muproteobacteria bacterium RBG_16_64_11]|uniref:2-amino-4-hydroxy-6-hydroxymethyldihydropteridine diphosphokinase n=1 Tax=Candidatus Muproteobacteria bacterium RBG_16_64_11 TaxID=1817758 RepID=A0A1F6TI94_9PROT|nr:MAG: 2-amino-4-hydroxy-6-hydroxymethyldihydropteridine diphosphokinase [Candidatus Muproteobacteria bacterium RBG_16_64_11]
MPRIFVSIGSNIEPERNIRGAVRALRAAFGALTLSRVYECPPQGFSGDNFYNLVASFESAEPAEAVKARLAAIEGAHGRTRGERRLASRTLDLDLLLYGDAVVHRAGLDLPRADIREYAFVLAPLAEIAPDLHHPETGESYKTMWEKFQPSEPLRTVALDLETDGDSDMETRY